MDIQAVIPDASVSVAGIHVYIGIGHGVRVKTSELQSDMLDRFFETII